LFLFGSALLLGGCANTAGPPSAAANNRRELTTSEKAALEPQIAANLKDPGAAQSKWMPVIDRERGGITDYCAMSRVTHGVTVAVTPA
jgi:hypothetical protein